MANLNIELEHGEIDFERRGDLLRIVIRHDIDNTLRATFLNQEQIEAVKEYLNK
jgi:hypothetical protein